jgi:hypothetical protein
MSKRKLTFDSYQSDFTKFNYENDLRNIIINILNELTSESTNSKNLLTNQKALEIKKKLNNKGFYVEISKLLMDSDPGVVLFCATQLKNSDALNVDMAKLIYENLKLQLPDNIKEILVNYFTRINNVNFFEFMLNNLKNQRLIESILLKILKSDIKLEFKHLIKFINTKNSNLKLLYKIIVKINDQITNDKTKYINSILNIIIEKFGLEKKVTLKICTTIFKKYSQFVDINLRKKVFIKLLKINTTYHKHCFILLYYILKSYKLKNKNIGKEIFKKFITYGFKSNEIIKMKAENTLEFFDTESPHVNIKDNSLRQITKKIIPLLDESLDILYLINQYNKINPTDLKNCLVLEILSALLYIDPVKKFLVKVYDEHTIKAMTNGGFHHKLCHLDIITEMVKNNVQFNESNFFKNLKKILNMKNPTFKISNHSPIIRLKIIKILTLIFEKGNMMTYDVSFGDVILFDVYLKNLFCYPISSKVVVHFYKFLRSKISKYERSTLNRALDSISLRVMQLHYDFSKYDPIFRYYLFEIIALLIRNINPVSKGGGYILNKQINKLCLNLIEVIKKTQDNHIKCFILQIFSLVNFYHLFIYDISKLKFEDNEVEIKYLKDKYDFVKLFAHIKGQKYYELPYRTIDLSRLSEFELITYPSFDPPNKLIKELELKNKRLYFLEGGKKCLFDYLLITLKYLNTPTSEFFIKNIINNDLNEIKKYPSLAILVSTYIILKNGKVENQDFLKEKLIDSLSFVNGVREYCIIKIALKFLNFDLEEKTSFDNIHNENSFGHMIFLKEARLYCIEKHSINKNIF